MSSQAPQAVAEGDNTAVKTPDMNAQAKPPARSGPRPMPMAGGGGPDDQFQMFMGPMFAELEAQVKEQERFLDEMNEKFEEERVQKRKAMEQEHIPKPLKGRGQELQSVMRTVEGMIMYEIDEDMLKEQEDKEEAPAEAMSFQEQMALWDKNHSKDKKAEEEEKQEKEEEKVDKRKKAQVRKLDSHGNAAITSHSLAAFLSCLNEDHLRRFVTKITSDCQLWLSKMFRFQDTNVFYHEEAMAGLARVCRLALYQKYPKYVSEGFEALYSRPPVIYLSSAASPGLATYICLQLGLPLSCVCSVPCNSLFGSSTKMDTEILEKLIQDDIAAAKTPVALVAYAGTPTVGHVDDLETIQELCKKHNIWLHVEGDNLATLSMITPPWEVDKAKYGDSITVSMGKWLGIPALPHATLFKVSDPTLTHAAQLNTFNPSTKLSCLPLWVILQSLGIEGIEERIKNSCTLAETMFDEIEKFNSIKQISRDVTKKEPAIRSISDLISKAISSLLVFDMVTPTVVFRYIDTSPDGSASAVASYAMSTGLEDTEEKEEERARKMSYYNALNIWLADSLQAENPRVEISTINVEREGVCIRFSPLDSAQVKGTTEEDVQAFAKSLGENIAILDATALNYEKFRMVVEQSQNLRIVEVVNWAGLGAVQYIPDEYLDTATAALGEKGEKEVNNLNMELVHRLKSTDMAFSLGHTESEAACVKFGLITDETDVQELVTVVQNLGREVQESSKYLESMSELIRQGIEAANKDLEEESHNKLAQEGVLRQIPMLSSVVNWWSPPPKNVVKGRTFNLASGSISSTEETYKYKMQIAGSSSPNGVSPRSPRVSESSSVGLPQSPTSPTGGDQAGQEPASPLTKTAGDVKAKLLTMNDGDLSEGQESIPSPNGNLRFNLDSHSVDVKRES